MQDNTKLRIQFKKDAAYILENSDLLNAQSQSQTTEEKYKHPDGHYHIYTDGSSLARTRKLGLGGVITTADDKDEDILIQKESWKKGMPRNRQNDAAEIMAATMLLNTLPAQSSVLLHTDFTETIYRARVRNTKNALHSKLTPLWQGFIEACDRHKTVTALEVNDRNSNPRIQRNMLLAHNAASLGSGANSQKELPPKLSKKYRGIFTYEEQDRHRNTIEEQTEQAHTEQILTFLR